MPKNHVGRTRAAWVITLTVIAACSKEENTAPAPAPETPAPTTVAAATNVAATTVAAGTVAGTAYFSSSKLSVTWTAPASGLTPTSYRVRWTDQGTNAVDSASVTTTSASLTDLKSKTTYKIDVTSCAASTCQTGTPASATTETPIEVFQLQGTGNTVSGLTKIVSDGNVRLHVMRYGNDATGGLAGSDARFGGASGALLCPAATRPAKAETESKAVVDCGQFRIRNRA